MGDIAIEQILYKFFYHMTYMSDDNQETKKNSKVKKTILDSLEGFLFIFVFLYFGVFGGFVLSIPLGTVFFLAKNCGDKKMEVVAVIFAYIFVILFGIWLIFYIKYIIVPKLLSTAAQNP